MDIIGSLYEKNFTYSIQLAYQLCLICKDFKEKNPIFLSLTILGNLFRYLKLRNEAVKIFELCRDLANETEDWG
jgi:hypothetical protein